MATTDSSDYTNGAEGMVAPPASTCIYHTNTSTNTSSSGHLKANSAAHCHHRSGSNSKTSRHVGVTLCAALTLLVSAAAVSPLRRLFTSCHFSAPSSVDNNGGHKYSTNNNSITVVCRNEGGRGGEGTSIIPSALFNTFFLPYSPIRFAVAQSDSDDFDYSTGVPRPAITIGYLRMQFADHTTVLTGYMSTVAKANAIDLIPGVTIRLNVTTINCNTEAECTNLTPEHEADVQEFLASMGRFAAVIKCNYILAPRLIDRATALGGLPIIDPMTVRAQDHSEGKGAHVVNFQPYITSEIAQLFTFMQQSAGCAFAGILYEEFSELKTHIGETRQMFLDGGLEAPPALDILRATTADIMHFLFEEEPRRKCFVMLMTYNTITTVFERLVKEAGFDPNARGLSFYGPALMSGGIYLANGTGAVYDGTYFTRWFPMHAGSTLEASNRTNAYFAEWYATYVPGPEGDIHFPPANGGVPAFTTDGTLLAYIGVQFLMESARSAIFETPGGTDGFFALSRPQKWAALLDGLYNNPRTVAQFPLLGRMTRECPQRPLDTTQCFCNRPTITSYLFKINGTTGRPFAVYDNIEVGQRGVASIENRDCHTAVSSRSYPITSLLIRVGQGQTAAGLLAEELGRPVDAAFHQALLVAQNVVDGVFNARVRSSNFAAIAARPLRHASFTIRQLTGTAQRLSMPELQNYLSIYNPFIIVGSVSSFITAADILTFLPSLPQIAMEDPPLASMYAFAPASAKKKAGEEESPHRQSAFAPASGSATPQLWQPNIIRILPVLADYVHALAAFYHARRARGGFTGFRAIVTIPAEAVLIAKSMATLGYDFPVENVVVSTSADVWAARMAQWLQPDGAGPDTPGPFVLAAVRYDPSGCLDAALRVVAASTTGGLLGIAADTMLLHRIRTTHPLTRDRDVLFASFLPDFWAPSMSDMLPVEQQPLADTPVFWYAKVVNDIVAQLSQRVLYDYATSAADILYSLSVVTSSHVTFGPFSAQPCSEEQIEANSRARECQCTKGARTIHVLSLRSWQNGVTSAASPAPSFSGDFLYRMNSCGIQYFPYVPPPAAAASLSAGAVAGIAVGASLGFLALVAAFILINLFVFGRNNLSAPKDPSLPFTIVFTDIQSSTALWARAPAAMLAAVEQHHSIIRRLIVKHNGYEVKTIGDSFMVAFKEAKDAVAFGIAVQQSLFAAEWNPEINACYREILAELRADAEEDGEEETNANPTTTFGGGSDCGDTKDVVAIGAHLHQFYASATADSVVMDSSLSAAPADDDEVVAFNANPSNNNFHPPVPATSDNAHTTHPSNTTAVIIGGGASPAGLLDGEAVSDTEMIAIMTAEKGREGKNADALASQAYDSASAFSASHWNGLRVRIGIAFGFGSIRKDEITHGYDYYGTVVNTAARVEGVGHGGQTLITEETLQALGDGFFANNNTNAGVGGGSGAIVAIALGPQPLRGLDEPIRLTQLSPSGPLSARRFPPLRLHIEVDFDESHHLGTDAGGTPSASADDATAATTATPEELAAQLCGTRQFRGVAVADLLHNLAVVTALLSPSKQKWQLATLAHIGDSWGLERSAAAVAKEATRARLLVTVMGRVTKALLVANRKKGGGGGGGRGGGVTVGSQHRHSHHTNATGTATTVNSRAGAGGQRNGGRNTNQRSNYMHASATATSSAAGADDGHVTAGANDSSTHYSNVLGYAATAAVGGGDAAAATPSAGLLSAPYVYHSAPAGSQGHHPHILTTPPTGDTTNHFSRRGGGGASFAGDPPRDAVTLLHSDEGSSRRHSPAVGYSVLQ